MPETSLPHESRTPGFHIEGIDRRLVTGREHHGYPVGGLAAYYRLRCIALEATIATLEAELDRKERRVQLIRDRYEELLQGRECGTEPVFTDL